MASVVITPMVSQSLAVSEVARLALTLESAEGGDTAQGRVVAALDKLPAFELLCVTGALRRKIGMDKPLAEVYDGVVELCVKRYKELVDGQP